MTYARKTRSHLSNHHQFNEVVPSDEGFDANTDDDFEPANLWGRSTLNTVGRQIEIYRRPDRDPDAPSAEP